LQGFGHVKVSRSVASLTPAGTPDPGEDSQNMPAGQSAGSVVGKLWRRLVGH